jgi:signal peptidase I
MMSQNNYNANSDSNKNNKNIKGGKFFPALCSTLGTVIIAIVIISFIPMAVPRLFGYEVYNVISGSMEPAIPVGSAVYVKYESPMQIEEGEVIAFISGSSIITHRIILNDQSGQTFTTKGDANSAEDMNKVSYNELVGVVKYHFPYVGNLMELYTTNEGKKYAILLAASGALINCLGAVLNKK